MNGKLLPIYRELAAKGGNFWGHSILAHESDIRRMVVIHAAKTALDFGCGRGDPWQEGLAKRLGLTDVTLYDPSFPSHDKLPAKGTRFDGVICSDVLEHVPEKEVMALLHLLFGYAEKFVWASVCCRPAKKFLPDGRNMHVTIRPRMWWESQFSAACRAQNIHRYGTEEGLDFRLIETD